MRRKRAWQGFLFVLPFLAGFALFFLISFLWSVVYSLTGGVGGIAFVGLDHYMSLLQSRAFLLAAQNTLKFLAVSVPLVMLLGLFVSLVLYQNFRGSSLLRAVFLFPLTVPIAALIAAVRFFFAEDGALNKLIALTGGEPRSWLGSGAAFGVLVLIFLWKNCGYTMLLFLAGLCGIPEELTCAAQIEGAHAGQVFWYIRMPLLKPTFFFTAVISIMNAFKIFREAYLIGGEHPDPSIYMLQHFMNNNFQNLNYQRLSAAAFLIFLFITLLVGGLFLWKNKGGAVAL
ncbi:MAG: sugar ABC transporter permease [Lachnospiraceae bacterium]|nr:sugar ABC transporter permease [Lachnospiraceae bacterium]MDE6939744.1 sugar ABC transporter permease [Lachnospiraceae bacterium]